MRTKYGVVLFVLTEGINTFVPQKKVAKSGIKKIRYSKKLRKLINKKKSLWKKSKSSKLKKDSKKYKKAAKKVKIALKCRELEAEKVIIKSNDKNRLHKYLKSTKSHNAGIAPLKNNSGDLISNPIDIANELNNAFVSMGTSDNGIIHPLVKPVLATEELNLVYFDAEETFKACCKLKPKFSVGPDGIPSVVYKKLAGCLATPLAMIYCLIMQLGALPDIWKTAIVVPLYKKGLHRMPIIISPFR